MHATKTNRGSRLVIATTGAVLIAVVVSAAFVGSRRGTASYPPGTPVATVQAFLQAVADERYGDALELVTDERREQCRTSPPTPLFDQRLTRVVLIQSSVDGDTARVAVAISQSFGDGGLFGADEPTFHQELLLIRTTQGWQISDGAWPFDCSGLTTR